MLLSFDANPLYENELGQSAEKIADFHKDNDILHLLQGKTN